MCAVCCVADKMTDELLALADTINVSAPWASPHAHLLDQTTAVQWVRNVTGNEYAVWLLEFLVNSQGLLGGQVRDTVLFRCCTSRVAAAAGGLAGWAGR